MRRIAFDLDETLGTPKIDSCSQMIGWQIRSGSVELLERLQKHFSLCIWSVSSRQYVNKAIANGLGRWFSETYSWDELPTAWKDIRRINADYLVDDSSHHRDAARKFGIESAYIVVPSYGSPEDVADPLGWVRQIESIVFAN